MLSKQWPQRQRQQKQLLFQSIWRKLLHQDLAIERKGNEGGGWRVLKKITYSHNYHKSKTTGKALNIFIIHREIELDKSGTNECSKIVSNGNIGENSLACKFSFDIERPKLNKKKAHLTLNVIKMICAVTSSSCISSLVTLSECAKLAKIVTRYKLHLTNYALSIKTSRFAKIATEIYQYDKHQLC